MWDDETETTQDNTKQSMQKEATKSLGIFFSKNTKLDSIVREHRNQNGSIVLEETEGGKIKTLTIHHFHNENKIIKLMSDLNEAHEGIVTYGYRTHYRQPRFTINFKCPNEQREAVWELIKKELSDLEIPEDMEVSSYSRPTTPCTSPMSSPRVRAKA